MKRIIFLDIDGVLNSEDFAVWCASTKDGKTFIQKGGNHFVDPKAVCKIKEICENLDVKIVLSSSWRMFDIPSSIKDLSRYRDLKELIPYIVGITPRLEHTRIRGEEIEWFINHKNYPPILPYNRFYDFNYFGNTKHEKYKYCIIDDDTDMLDSQKTYFIHINNFKGITKKDIQKIKQVLT